MTDHNNDSAANGKMPGPQASDRQQWWRFALALLTPVLRRALLAILPIRMGPVKEAPGLVEAQHRPRSAVVDPKYDAPPQGRPVDPTRPRGRSSELLVGKTPSRLVTDLKIEGENVVRFDIHQRVQHVLMFTSFLTLTFTGLPQKTHAFGPSQWLIAALGGLEMTQAIHHVAAYVMLFDCVYHAAYIVVGALFLKKLSPLRMVPTLKDFKDAFQQFSYFLGVTDKAPRFGRYSYLEKFDYWAVFWGIVVIGGSGLVLMFPVWATKLAPGQIIPVALVAHSDEAVLAVGWIFVVHFFYAHFVPRIFPFNPSIFTGRVPKERYREEHPLDWERVEPILAWAEREAGANKVVQSNNGREDGAARLIKLVGIPTGGADLDVRPIPEQGDRRLPD